MYKMIFGLKALLVSAFFVLAANVLQSIYVPTIAVSMGMNSFQVSLLGSFYFIGFVIGCLILPRFLYAVGHIRTFSSFATLSAISTLIISMTDDPIVWMFCRLLTGLCLSGLYMSIESWISGFSNPSNRGRIISIYRTVDILGCLAGQFILFSFVELPYVLNFVAIGFLLSALPLSLTKVHSPVLAEADAEKLVAIAKSVFKATPLGIYGVIFSGVASGIFWSLLPVFTEANQISNKYNPVFVVCYLIGGALIQWPIGMLSDRIDRRLTIIFSSLVALSASWIINYLIYIQSADLNTLMILMGLIGVGSIPIYSLSVAHTNDGIKKSSLVGLSVLMLVLSSLGSVIGPFAFGATSSLIDAKYLLIFSASAHTLLFIGGIYYLVTKDKIKQVNKKVFMFLSRTNSLVVAGSHKIIKK